MKRKAETGVIILLPLIILGMLVLIARVMSAHYMALNGFDQAAKIYGEEFTIDRKILDSKPGQALRVNVTVKNTGNFVWPHTGSNLVHMSYHILDVNRKPVFNDGLRTDLPSDILPGQKVTVPLQVKAPELLGSFILQLDMVQEGVAWFGEKGSNMLMVNINIK